MDGTRRSFLFLTHLTALLVLILGSSAVAAPGGAGGDSRQHVRVIVVLHDGADARATAEEMSRRHGGELSFVYERALAGFAGVFPEGRLDNIERDRRVAYVELDDEVHLTAQTTPTGIERIFADTNGNLDIDGSDDFRVDVDVAVIDTGIDFEHPDLNVAGGVDCTLSEGGGPPWARTYYCSDTEGTGGDDDHYHGTHVAGTIGAIDNGDGVVGVAPGAALWAVKVLDSSGSGYESGVVAGIDWVAANAGTIEVANMSLGGSGFSQAEYDAIQGAVEAGVAFAVAAGNSDDDANDYSPAAFDNVLTVSALADFDGAAGGDGTPTCRDDQDDTLADFSNWGNAVQIAAPGVCILSTFPIEDGSYGTISGTSMASPHAAGALALLASSDDPASATDVHSLYDQVIDSGNFNWVDDSGDGIHEPLLDVSSTTVFAPTLVATDGGTEPTDDPPAVSITSPADGAAVSGTVSVTADATDDNGVSQVEFFVDGSSLATDTDGSDGWSASWDTTSVADGSHELTATATDTAGQSTTSASVTVTVDNGSSEGGGDGTLTVSSETYSQFGGRTSDKHLDVTLGITDGSSGVSGASVTIDLYRNGALFSGGLTGTTDSSGNVTFSFRDIGPGCYAAVVTDISASGGTWDGSDPDSSSC